MFRYRNDYDTPRHIPDAIVTEPDGTQKSAVVDPGEEFDSENELQNRFLTPIKPAGLSWNETMFVWEKRSEDTSGPSPDLSVGITSPADEEDHRE